MSTPIPFAKSGRVLLGEWFKQFPQGTQSDLDAFREQHPEFEYHSAELLMTKRRQLLTRGILSPVNDDDMAALARVREIKAKRKITPYHPAERRYRRIRVANRQMRGETKY